MNNVLASALAKVKAGKCAELNGDEQQKLYAAAREKAPKRPKEQLEIEAPARAKFSADDIEKHDTLQDIYEGLREHDLDDDLAQAAVDNLVPAILGWNAEQAEAKFADIESAIAENYGKNP